MAVGIAGELFLIWRLKGRIVLDLAVEGWRESLVSCSGCACLDVLVEGWWRELLVSELFALDLAVEGWRESLVSCSGCACLDASLTGNFFWMPSRSIQIPEKRSGSIWIDPQNIFVIQIDPNQTISCF